MVRRERGHPGPLEAPAGACTSTRSATRSPGCDGTRTTGRSGGRRPAPSTPRSCPESRSRGRARAGRGRLVGGDQFDHRHLRPLPPGRRTSPGWPRATSGPRKRRPTRGEEAHLRLVADDDGARPVGRGGGEGALGVQASGVGDERERMRSFGHHHRAAERDRVGLPAERRADGPRHLTVRRRQVVRRGPTGRPGTTTASPPRRSTGPTPARPMHGSPSRCEPRSVAEAVSAGRSHRAEIGVSHVRGVKRPLATISLLRRPGRPRPCLGSGSWLLRP